MNHPFSAAGPLGDSADPWHDERAGLLDQLYQLQSVLDHPKQPSSRHSPGEQPDLAILDDDVPLAVSERISGTNLLDLHHIFEDELLRAQRPGQPEPMPAAAPEDTPAQLEAMVQLIVDELVPQLEDRLRQHLMTCSEDFILQLAEEILDR